MLTASKQAEELCALLQPGDVVQGKVTGVRSYGAFVKIGRLTRKQALLHISQISQCQIADINSVLGPDYFIKVR